MNDSIRNSLAGRFFLTISVIISLAMGVGTLISFTITNRTITESTKLQLQRQVDGAIQHTGMWLEAQRVQVFSLGREEMFWKSLGDNPESEDAKDLVENRLSWMGLSFPYFSSLSLLSEEGEVVVSDLLEEERALLSVDESLYKRALAGELVVAPAFKSFHNQRYVFAVYSAVTHRGETVGVLYFEYDLATLNDLFFKEVKSGQAGYTFLVDNGNRVILQPDEQVIDPDELNKQFEHNLHIKDQFIEYKNSETRMFAYSGFVDFLDCSLFLNIPYSEILAPSRQLGKINILVTIVSIFLTVCLLTIVWRKEIAAPIEEIIRGINAFHNGTLEKPVGTQFRNEFKTVAESFNSMAVDIEHSTVSIEVLKEEQKNLQTILDSMIIGILIVDQDEETMMINSSLLRMLGRDGGSDDYTDLLAKTRKESEIFTNLKTTQHEELEFTNSKGIGYNILRVVQSISLNHTDVFLAMFVDISSQKIAEKEQQQLEHELQAAGRLKAIGTLAAGIAHEINTPIQYVGDNVRFVSEAMTDLLDVIATYKREFDECKGKGTCGVKMGAIKVKEDEVDLDFLQEEIPLSLSQSLDGLKNVGRIVLAMKTFSHQGEESKTSIDVNLAIENTLMISKNQWKLLAEVDHIADVTIPQPECFSGEINQVLLNLIINAAHAIEAKGLENPLETERIIIKTFSDEGYVCITVSDTGIGMTDEVKKRVFEHFFTTKEVGRGTGQGLSLSYQVVVEKHNGQLFVDSSPGNGSTFTVKLPVESSS